ncbi:hypothetical protein [Neobacillus drentensis]|uniref:hypothetical protein n=1 Tax=Neobacillus drentensis TaxID=220684 RepID=UPI002FFFE4D5
MLTHFLRAVIIQGSLFNVQREKQVKGDPTGAAARRAARPPAESERLERKSTAYAKRSRLCKIS